MICRVGWFNAINHCSVMLAGLPAPFPPPAAAAAAAAAADLAPPAPLALPATLADLASPPLPAFRPATA